MKKAVHMLHMYDTNLQTQINIPKIDQVETQQCMIKSCDVSKIIQYFPERQ